MTYATDEAALLPGTDRDLHEEQQVILDEVHEMFPQKVHRIAHLFETGSAALEALLHRWNTDSVLVRSLFLQRDGFVAHAYADGLDHFYRLMYGKEEYARGYLVVGESFLDSGFLERADAALQLGIEKASEAGQSTVQDTIHQALDRVADAQQSHGSTQGGNEE